MVGKKKNRSDPDLPMTDPHTDILSVYYKTRQKYIILYEITPHYWNKQQNKS